MLRQNTAWEYLRSKMRFLTHGQWEHIGQNPSILSKQTAEKYKEIIMFIEQNKDHIRIIDGEMLNGSHPCLYKGHCIDTYLIDLDGKLVISAVK